MDLRLLQFPPLAGPSQLRYTTAVGGEHPLKWYACIFGALFISGCVINVNPKPDSGPQQGVAKDAPLVVSKSGTPPAASAPPTDELRKETQFDTVVALCNSGDKYACQMLGDAIWKNCLDGNSDSCVLVVKTIYSECHNSADLDACKLMLHFDARLCSDGTQANCDEWRSFWSRCKAGERFACSALEVRVPTPQTKPTGSMHSL
jgi:hypothetical protein